MANTKGKGLITKVGKLLYYIVISFVCLIGAFLIYYIISSQINSNNPKYRPAVSIYTIVSPSMTPVINVYDVVVNIKTKNAQDIQVGDIITYISSSPTSEGMTITHRVIEINELEDGSYEYLTQGDNNSIPDSLYVSYDQIIGKEIAVIPYLGQIQFLIANQKGWLFLLLIPIAILLLKDVYKIFGLFGLRKKVEEVAGLNETTAAIEQQIKEQERKEKIKENILQKQINKDSYKRNEKEPIGFLEKYSETIIEVKENKYNNQVTNKENVDKKIETIKAEIPEKEEQKTIKPIQIQENVEILDTDDLTNKIKEYDVKIAELDKMLKTIEEMSKNPQSLANKEIQELLQEKFLQDRKIKVSEITGIKTEIKEENNNSNIPEKKKLYLNPHNIKQIKRVSKNMEKINNNSTDTIIEPTKKKKTKTKKKVIILKPQRRKLITIKKIKK